jgi:hypothetical protein
MQENTWVQTFWVACVASAIVASVLAIWSRRARYVGCVDARLPFWSSGD